MDWKPIKSIPSNHEKFYLKVGDKTEKGSLKEFPNAEKWTTIEVEY